MHLQNCGVEPVICAVRRDCDGAGVGNRTPDTRIFGSVLQHFLNIFDILENKKSVYIGSISVRSSTGKPLGSGRSILLTPGAQPKLNRSDNIRDLGTCCVFR